MNFQKQYRKLTRAPFLDYNSGDFFITIVTSKWKHYFGEISEEKMHLSKVGEILKYHLDNVSSFDGGMKIPLYTIMPNHVHFIICVNSDKVGATLLERLDSPLPYKPLPILSNYINHLKGAVTKDSRKQNLEFAWQSSYMDRQIRNIHEMNLMCEYIENNVIAWKRKNEKGTCLIHFDFI